MNKLYKPDGQEMKVHDDSLEHALSIGWTKEKPVKKAVKKPVAKKAK